MRRAIVTLLVLLSFGLKAQVYQAMPQAGYGPVKRMLFDSVLTIPLNINQLRNITGGRDAGQIRYNVTDSGLYVFSGFQWIKANLDSTNISNRINGKLNISDTAAMLLPYMKFIDTVSLSNRINLRVKYSDTAAMLDPYLRKLDTASLSRRIDEKQNIIKLTTNFKSGAATLIRDTLNIPKYSDTLSDAYVPYVGANKDVDLGVYDLTGTFLTANAGVEIQDNGAGIGDKVGYTSLYTSNEAFNFRTSRLLPNNLTKSRQATFLYPVEGDGYLTTFNYNLPVRTGTLALVEDTVNLSNRINLKADKATTLTINGVTYNLSANRTWTIPTFDSTSISNRINLKLNISDTASMLSPYLREADTSSLSNRIDLRVKYSDTAAMLSPYLKSAVTSVGLSMPSAFSVTNSPVTSTGTLTVTGAGNTSQYIDGTGALQTMQGIVTEVETLVKEVYNETGATLTKGTVVFINGGHGNLPTVTKAAASSDSLSAQTFGLVKADISDNSNGYVIVIGDLIDMPTSAFLEGTQLYLSPTAGLFTSTKQYAPSHLVYVGVVTRSHPTQGVISVKIQNGYEMDELHNVSAQSPSNNSLLQYKTSTNLWTKVEGTTSNIAEGTNLYYTDARVSNKMNYTDTASLSNRINAKADALIGTTNTVPKFTSSTTIGNSNIKDDGNVVSVSTTIGNFGALQVGSYNGNILMNTTNTNGGLIFQNTSSSNKLWDFSSDNNDLVFNESNVNPVMKLKAGGNVVISNLSGTGTRMVVADANGVLSSQAISSDTTSLSNRINLKLNISDTASMLSPYLRKADTSSLSNRINLKLNISDTASMLSGYQSAINSKQAAITLTTTGTSGAATFSSNTLNIPQYQAAGTYVTSVTGTSPIVSSGGTTPAISIPAASSSVNGYLSSTDWSTFNGKESVLTFSSPLVRTTNTISIPVATGSANGYLSATDWTTFNNKVSTATLSGYLPLTGGTLTGALGGTSATFSGLLTGTNAIFNTGASVTPNFIVYGGGSSSGGGKGNIRSSDAGGGNYWDFGRDNAVTGDFVLSNLGSTPYFRVATLTGAATFSSSVTSSFGSSGANFNSNAATTGAVNAYRVSNTTGVGSYGIESNAGGDLMTGGLSNATLLQSISNTALQFGTNQAARMTITTGGNVGIGTTSPNFTTTNRTTLDVNGTSSSLLALSVGGASKSYLFQSGNDLFLNNTTGLIAITAETASNITFATSNTERMRITSGGNVLIGGTYNTARLTAIGAGNTSAANAFAVRSLDLDNLMYIRNDGFFNSGTGSYSPYNNPTTGRSMVIESGGGLGYLVSTRESKGNIQSISNVSFINQLNPVSFNYRKKDNLTNEYTDELVENTSYGFIADEVEKVNKDLVFYNVENDGTKKLAGVEYNSMIAILTKAIQELSAKNEALIKRIETLENK
jgi:hypothetical protein